MQLLLLLRTVLNSKHCSWSRSSETALLVTHETQPFRAGANSICSRAVRCSARFRLLVASADLSPLSCRAGIPHHMSTARHMLAPDLHLLKAVGTLLWQEHSQLLVHVRRQVCKTGTIKANHSLVCLG